MIRERHHQRFPRERAAVGACEDSITINSGFCSPSRPPRESCSINCHVCMCRACVGYIPFLDVLFSFCLVLFCGGRVAKGQQAIFYFQGLPLCSVQRRGRESDSAFRWELGADHRRGGSVWCSSSVGVVKMKPNAASAF